MNTQDEFKALLMLYAANIDGTIHPDEMELILQHVDPTVVSKLKKDFSKMSDTQILDLIHENKSKFITDDTSRQQILDDIRSIVAADGRRSPMEAHLMRTLKKILA